MGNIIGYHKLFFGALLWKGGSAMSLAVNLGWKSFVALGVAVCGIILVSKIDSDAAERVLTHAVDACKEFFVAENGDR